MKTLKKLTVVLSLILLTSCGASWQVSTLNHDPIYDDENYITVADGVIVDTLSEFQFRNKLRTDIGFRLDFARYALSQPRSFDWNNRLLGRQYDSRWNSYYWNRDQMWNDWAWGYTGWNSWGSPHRWSPFGYDRWGYNMYYGWNNHGWGYNNWMGNVHYGNGYYNNWGWNNYYGNSWRRGNTAYIYGRRGTTTTRNGRAHASMIESTKRTTKPRRVIRTNTAPINNNITKPRRVIREKPVVPVIRNNNTRPRNNTRPVIRNNNNRPTYNNRRPSNNTRPTINRTNTSRPSTPTRTTSSRNGNGGRKN